MDSTIPNQSSHSWQLFDFQVNGFGGVDFQSDALTREDWLRGITALRNHGTTQIFVALITDEIDRLCRRLEAIELTRGTLGELAETIAGYHLEGPWLNNSAGYCGAHAAHHMHAPHPTEFDRLQSAARGRIRLVTLAPELPRSAEFIAHLAQQDVKVSLGHTDASEGQIDEAIQAGAEFCTHLGNATPALLPRHNNVIQRLLARDELTACFIPDGIHLPSYVLRNFFRAKPAGRVLFTTDAMAGAASGSGPHTLGDLVVEVDANGVARQPGKNDGFAGSTLTPDEGVRRTSYYLGISVCEAAHLWSDAPRKAFNVKAPIP